MDARRLIKGQKYEYVRKDGSVHVVTYVYKGINFYMFKMQHCNTAFSMTHSMVQERVREI
ncbi:MAG: hypothetical protein ACTTKI_00535 [Tannerella sp.]|uniref:hypothetical protein n=1 Tax=Tannerella sp. TaxID=2382127 RepID=UPI003FA2E587